LKERYSKEEIVELLKKYYQENNQQLTLDLYNKKKYKPSETTIRKRFGSWNEALEEAGIPINRAVDKWYSKEDVIKFLRKISEDGKAPTVDEYKKMNLSPNFDTVISRFGTWNEAIKQAGLEENRVLMDREEIINQLKLFAKKYPENISSEFYRNMKWKPSQKSIENQFGSWMNGLKEAGIDTDYQTYSNEDLLDELNRCMEFVYPRKLTMKQFDEMNKKPSSQTIYRRFGSWKKAITLAKEKKSVSK